MAVREIKQIFAIDGERKYIDAIKQINDQQKKLNLELGASAAKFDLVGDKQGGLRAKIETLNRQIDLQRQKVSESKDAMERSIQKFGENSEATQELTRDYYSAEAGLAKLQKQLISANKDLELQESKLKAAGDAAEKAGEKMKMVGDKMSAAGSALTASVTAPIVAAAGFSVKAAMDFESAFAGVRKTVDATEEELSSLEQGIRDLSKEVPASALEISAVAEAAGQLGIQTPNILEFSEAMIAMGEATNLTSDEASTSLAQFANITQMDQSNFERLASSIVAVGNAGASTEKDVTNMALRLAGAGNQVGMSEADIVGLAASLADVGIEAEAGGTAFSKVMIQMQLAASTGTKAGDVLKKTGMSLRDLEMFADADAKGFKAMAHSMGYTAEELKGFMDASKSLDAFSKATGISAEEFKKAYEKDAVGAIQLFVKNLATAGDRGEDAITILEEMGITEVRMRDALLRSAGAGDKLAGSIALSNKAWKENNALSNEAAKRYETNESKMKMARNRITDAAMTIGQQLLPVVADLVDDVAKAAEAFGKLDPEMQKTALVALGVAAAIGPVAKTLGVVTSVGGTTVKTFGTIAKKFAEHKATAAAASAANASLGGSFAGAAASAGPLIAVLGGIALAVGGAYLAYQKANENFFAAGEASGKFTEGLKSVRDEIYLSKSALEGFDFSKIFNNMDLSKIDGGIAESHEKIKTLAKTVAAESRSYTDEERKQIEELIGLINDYTQQKIDGYVKQQEVYSAYVAQEKDVTITRANELIKGSEDAMNQTIAVAESKYKDMITVAEEQYGHMGEIDERAYQRAVENAEKIRDTQIEKANEAHAETLSIVTSKYMMQLGEDGKYLQDFASIGEQLKQAEENQTKYIEEETAKRVTAKMTERQKGQTERDIEKEAQKQFNEEVEPLYEELAKAYEGATQANLDNWLYMVADTELYGGEVSDQVKEVVEGIVTTFDYLPEESKEAAYNAMDGLRKGMEEQEPSLFKKAAGIANSIMSIINSAFDNRSPSHKLEKIGSFAMQGLDVGLEKSGDDAIKTAGNVAGEIIDSLAQTQDVEAMIRAKVSESGLSRQIDYAPTASAKLMQKSQSVLSASPEAGRVTVGGTVYVQGVNDEGQTIAVVELVKNELQKEWMMSGR